GRLAPAARAALLFPTLPGLLRRSGVVGRVLAADVASPVEVAPLGVEEGAATRAASLLGEERLDRCDRVDLAAARPAGKLGHSLHGSRHRSRRREAARRTARAGRPVRDLVDYVGWGMWRNVARTNNPG